MKIVSENSAGEFLKKNEALLLSHESEHNLLLGLAQGLALNTRTSNQSHFYTIEVNGLAVGQAMRTDADKPLILSRMNIKYIPGFIEYLKNESLELKGVIGPDEIASLFKDQWGASSEIGMHQGIYQLDEVVPPNYQGGGLCLVGEDNLDQALKMCLGFIHDCFPNQKNAEQSANEAARRHIKNKCLFFWKDSDSKVVSMAANSRETKNGATLSWVYTPKELRGSGYASSIVAALSQKLLDDGKEFTNLFTDLLNPTSNSIYQKVGYKRVASSIHFNFI